MPFQTFFLNLKDKIYQDLPYAGHHYFAGTLSYMQRPDRCFVYLRKFLPSYITTVLYVGSGNGRNLLAFKDLEHYSIDLAPQETINWARGLSSHRHKSMMIQDLTRELETEPKVDLSNLLIISSGSLLYVDGKEQEKFYRTAERHGCRNFIFQEYLGWTSKHGDMNLQLPPADFVIKRFREHFGSEQPAAFIRLDVPDAVRSKLGQAHTSVFLSGSRVAISRARLFARRKMWQVAGILVRLRNKLHAVSTTVIESNEFHFVFTICERCGV